MTNRASIRVLNRKREKWIMLLGMVRRKYVGEAITEQEIKAKFENGVLQLSIPKKEAPKVPEKKLIAIEG